MLLASGFYGYVIGSVNSFVQRNTLRERKHREHVISMTNQMRKNKIPKELQFKCRSYMEYVYENQKNMNIREDAILNLLSEPLKDEISAFIHYPIIKTCPTFYKFLSPTAVTTIMKNLKEETYAPDDEIFKEGEKNRTLYLVIEGSVSVYYKQTKSSIAELKKGSYFGEIGFFAGHARTASVKCLEFSDMLSLNFEKTWLSLTKDLKAQEVIMLIESLCENEDYTEIDVRCYICKVLGHVALKCPLMICHDEAAKDEWLKRRGKGNIKINPFDPPIAKYKRRSRKIIGKYNGHNVISRAKDPTMVFRKHTRLREKASKFFSNFKSNSNSTSISEVSSRHEIFEAPSFTKYSVIISDSESGGD